MSITHPTPLEGIDHILADLPDGWVIGWWDEGRLVIGPSGAFVLTPGQLDLGAAADRAQWLAQHTRSQLARHLSWVPFIDAAVVSVVDPPIQPAVAAIVVPVDLLSELLIEGNPVIEPTALAVLATLLGQGELHGWREGSATSDVKIDLCEPQPNAPRGAHL